MLEAKIGSFTMTSDVISQSADDRSLDAYRVVWCGQMLELQKK
jgi:hypothetical protein